MTSSRQRAGAGVLLFVLFSAACSSPNPEPRRPATLRPAGPLRLAADEELFSDVAAESGLGFVHFNGMTGECYFCEHLGAGVGLLDYDNDGDLDVYLVQGTLLGSDKTIEQATFPYPGPRPIRDRLFRNDLQVRANGTRTLRFTDVTDQSGLDARSYGFGVATGDVDNDGFVDLYVTSYGPNYLYLNNGDGTFSDATERSGTQDDRFSTSAAFLDYDRDGWLDLFVVNYVNYEVEQNTKCFSPTGRLDYCSPNTFEPVPDRLFRNRGDGTFEDVTIPARVAGEFGNGLGVVAADLNGDGWTDIYVANDQVANQLWINRQDGTFRNDALLAGVAFNCDGSPEASMGVDAADFDGDGDDDIFLSHLKDETNTIYVNLGNGLFEDRTNQTGLGASSVPFTGFGTAWFDLDNDGWLDLLVANGAVVANEELALAGDPHPLHEINQLFRNLGDGRFEDITGSGGEVFRLSEVSRGAAFGDIDNDGDVDVVLTNNAGPVRLLRNNIGNRADWLGLRLVGREVARDMLGAQVGVTQADGSQLWRRVRADASYLSANDPRVLVGLGSSAKIRAVRVHWPDGSAEEWTKIPTGSWHTLTQGTGAEVDRK